MTDTVVRDAAILGSLDGSQYTDGGCNIADYLDRELADIGIIGGSTRCRFSHAEGLRLCTDYWAPRSLEEDELRQLVQYTIAQWEDGIGESGFLMSLRTKAVDVFPSCQEEDVIVDQHEDGTDVPSPSHVAIGARDGDLDALTTALEAGESVEGTIQGYGALHLAILYGNVDAALTLIQHGADVNRLDCLGDSPLHLCATSNALEDEECATIAQALIKAGADRGKPSATGESVAALAKIRGKENLREAVG